MIRTERLTLRRFAKSDMKALQRIFTDQASSPYAKYDTPKATDDESVAARAARWASFSESEEHMFFSVCLEGEMIGYIAMNKREDGYETGFNFMRAHQGKGYARESMTALLDGLQKAGASRVTAGTAQNNTPSVRLLLACGFVKTGEEDVSFYKDENGAPVVFKGLLFERKLNTEGTKAP